MHFKAYKKNWNLSEEANFFYTCNRTAFDTYLWPYLKLKDLNALQIGRLRIEEKKSQCAGTWVWKPEKHIDKESDDKELTRFFADYLNQVIRIYFYW